MIIKLAIALAVVLAVAAFTAWAFLPARYLPGNRARHLRIRLHLRLHPGKGFAHAFSLWLRWGRLAALRRSGRIRRSLPWWLRFVFPGLLLGACSSSGSGSSSGTTHPQNRATSTTKATASGSSTRKAGSCGAIS